MTYGNIDDCDTISTYYDEWEREQTEIFQGVDNTYKNNNIWDQYLLSLSQFPIYNEIHNIIGWGRLDRVLSRDLIHYAFTSNWFLYFVEWGTFIIPVFVEQFNSLNVVIESTFVLNIFMNSMEPYDNDYTSYLVFSIHYNSS